MKLSKNFSLAEMVASPSATRWGFDEQFNPPEDIIVSLDLLCNDVLQPIRDYLGIGVRVTSGYRCPRLNAKLGGAYSIINGKPVQTSQHTKGEAADIQCIIKGEKANHLILEAVIQLASTKNFEFDQLIVEFGTEKNPSWVHISYKKTGNRNQVLRAYKEGKKTKYRHHVL